MSMMSNKEDHHHLEQQKLTTKLHVFGGAVPHPSQRGDLTPQMVMAVAFNLAENLVPLENNKQSIQPPSVPRRSSKQLPPFPAPTGSGESMIQPRTPGSTGGGGGGVSRERSLSGSEAMPALPNLGVGASGNCEPRIYSENPSHCIPYTVWIAEAWQILKWAEPSASLFWEVATMFHTLFLAARSDFLHSPTFGFNSQPGSSGQHALNHPIPPILPCGSNISDRSFGSTGGHSVSSHASHQHMFVRQAKKNPAASAKELPVWLVSVFLLLHLEEHGRKSAEKFNNMMWEENSSSNGVSVFQIGHHLPTRFHSVSLCKSFLLGNLRHILLLMSDPQSASMREALLSNCKDIPSTTVGLLEKVEISDIELERLNFILQQSAGGHLDEVPLQIARYFFTQEELNKASRENVRLRVPLLKVEARIRKLLDSSNKGVDKTLTSSMERLSLGSQGPKSIVSEGDTDGGNTDMDFKEVSYTNFNSTTLLLRPLDDPEFEDNRSNNITKLHDLRISVCSDVYMYLLQPFESVTISGCMDCTIVIGAVAGILHIVDCDRINVTVAARRILVRNSREVKTFCFTPSPPLLAGKTRACQFAPYNTYYDGLRDDLLSTGLAAAVVPYHAFDENYHYRAPQLQCASNKWKVPIEVSKLGLPLPSNEAFPTNNLLKNIDVAVNEDTMHTPILLPASEYNILFIPFEKRQHSEEGTPIGRRKGQNDSDSEEANTTASSTYQEKERPHEESRYCRYLSDILNLCPFKLPVEFERTASQKGERVRALQQAIKDLDIEQRAIIDEEIKKRFGEWLGSTGNLRQVLDLSHMEEQHVH